MGYKINLAKSDAAFSVFLAAAVAGVSVDLGGAMLGWTQHHTMAHFFFGLGFPFVWVTIFSIKRKEDRAKWQIHFDSKFTSPFGDGFWLGGAITMVWSMWNEILVYRIYNPKHPADWHHWMADHLGLLTGYVLMLAWSRNKKTGVFGSTDAPVTASSPSHQSHS